MTSMQLVKDKEGQSYIPPSQRPDGTWRKPIRVRDGYVPQEEQPVYISKGRQPNDTSPYPVGLSAADIEALQARGSGSQGFPVGYFEVGDYFKQAAGIPGLNFVESSDPVTAKAKSKKSKNKGKSVDSSSNNKITKGQATATAAGASSSAETPSSSQTVQTDPTKRLRNLKKRLKEIEDLEKRISSGELSSPEKEQLEKLRRKDEVEEEIEDLEKLLTDLNVS